LTSNSKLSEQQRIRRQLKETAASKKEEEKAKEKEKQKEKEQKVK